MNNLKWFYPETESECLDLLKNGYRPHAGGTFLVKTSLNQKGFFDLSSVKSLKTKSVVTGGVISLGASLSYSEAASFLETEIPGNFLSAAMGSAAATPLRNRITVGGSICSSPKWSDITAPLYASDAKILLTGIKDPVEYRDFISTPDLVKNSLVSAVLLQPENLAGSYFRFTFTGFDYPVFSIALSLRGGFLNCAVSGCKKGAAVLSGSPESIAADAAAKLDFNDERGLSGSYIKNRALTELQRLITTTGAANG